MQSVFSFIFQPIELICNLLDIEVICIHYHKDGRAMIWQYIIYVQINVDLALSLPAICICTQSVSAWQINGQYFVPLKT